MKINLILVCVFALLFSACAAPGLSQPTATILPTDPIVSTPEPTLPPVQVEPTAEATLAPAETLPTPTSGNLPAMQTYTDDFAGFSLDYPAGWFLESSALIHA